MEENETIAQRAKRLIAPIPAEDFIVNEFTNGKDKCCVLGHYNRLTSGRPDDYSHKNCDDPGFSGNDLGRVSHNFLKGYSIATVNNRSIRGYRQDGIKERVMACLEDMINAGL